MHHDIASSAREDPKQLVWDDRTLSQFWAYQSRFPDNYFSYKKGAEVSRYLQKYLPPRGELLDYGCGPGHFIPHLLEKGFKVLGADFDQKTIGQAVQVSGHPNFLGYAVVDELLQSGRVFDAVVMLEVVEHLSDDWLSVTLRNARNLLKPGGVLAVTTPNEERLDDGMVYCPVCNLVFHRWQHVRTWSASSLAKTLRTFGFADVQTFARTFGEPRTPIISPLRYEISRIVSRLRKPQSLIAIARN